MYPSLPHYLTDHKSRIPGVDYTDTGMRKYIKQTLLRPYKKTLCLSDYVLRSMQEQEVWPNLTRCAMFIDPERFTPDAGVRANVRQRYEAEDKFIILTVAHLIRWKGVDVAIRALTKLPESVVLWVVGSGEEQDNLQKLCLELGLANRVRFFGKQRNVAPYMQAADCFTCPSIWEEAMGLVNLEALACQLPVIASDIGGIPEFVDDQKTGYLFPPGDYHQLAERLCHLVRHPEVLQQMGQQARCAAVERFSVQKLLPAYLDLYRHTDC